jgi:hypothetical protein
MSEPEESIRCIYSRLSDCREFGLSFTYQVILEFRAENQTELSLFVSVLEHFDKHPDKLDIYLYKCQLSLVYDAELLLSLDGKSKSCQLLGQYVQLCSHRLLLRDEDIVTQKKRPEQVKIVGPLECVKVSIY